LEEEVVKKRLEALDPYFRKFQMVYQQIVDTIKIKNISPLQMFQMFDVNGDGKISKNEFGDAIGNLGINIVSEEMEVLYMFVDLDGTGEIEY
jgi:Ca2+-binding EF-hand superfamily protein